MEAEWQWIVYLRSMAHTVCAVVLTVLFSAVCFAQAMPPMEERTQAVVKELAEGLRFYYDAYGSFPYDPKGSIDGLNKLVNGDVVKGFRCYKEEGKDVGVEYRNPPPRSKSAEQEPEYVLLTCWDNVTEKVFYFVSSSIDAFSQRPCVYTITGANVQNIAKASILGLPVEDVRKMGCVERYISQWERGHRLPSREDTIRSICMGFAVSLMDHYTRCGSYPYDPKGPIACLGVLTKGMGGEGSYPEQAENVVVEYLNPPPETNWAEQKAECVLLTCWDKITENALFFVSSSWAVYEFTGPNVRNIARASIVGSSLQDVRNMGDVQEIFRFKSGLPQQPP